MNSSAPSLGQGLLLFCEMYAGALFLMALGLVLGLLCVPRHGDEAARSEKGPKEKLRS